MKRNIKKLTLRSETLRTLRGDALPGAAGGISGNRVCNFSDISCQCNHTGGATCYTVGAAMCNSGAGAGTCTC